MIAALTSPVSAYEFGAVLMYLAKHRGMAPKKRNGSVDQQRQSTHFNSLPGHNWQRRDATHAFARLWRIQAAGLSNSDKTWANKMWRKEIAAHVFSQETHGHKSGFNPLGGHDNDTEKRMVHQLQRVLDAIVTRFGQLDIIVVETFQKPENQNAHPAVKPPRRNLNEVSRRAQLRHRLWLELPEIRPDIRQCIYSGIEIALNDLNSENFEIDHIVPSARGGRNVYDNLLLCSARANRDKNDRRVQHVPQWRDDLDIILQRAKVLPKQKQIRLETGEEPGPQAAYVPQLGHRARKNHMACMEYLEGHFGTRATRLLYFKGHETAEQRDVWQLNTLLSDGATGKNRHDHRHHAIDAFVLAALATGGFANGSTARKELADLLPGIVTSHKVDHGSGQRQQLNRGSGGMLTQETAFGPTPFHDATGRSLGVIRKPVAELKTVNDVNMVRDTRLRNQLLAQLSTLESNDNHAIGQTLDHMVYHRQANAKRPAPTLMRVRVFEAIHNPVMVRDANYAVIKFLKPGANFRFDVWALKDGRWIAEIVTMAQAADPRWQSPLKRHYPAARKVLKLHHNDCIALNEAEHEGGQVCIMRVVKFSANDRVCLVPVNAAGDLKARDADRLDPFHYTIRSPAGLKSRKARQVRIDILGRVSDPLGFAIRANGPQIQPAKNPLNPNG